MEAGHEGWSSELPVAGDELVSHGPRTGRKAEARPARPRVTLGKSFLEGSWKTSKFCLLVTWAVLRCQGWARVSCTQCQASPMELHPQLALSFDRITASRVWELFLGCKTVPREMAMCLYVCQEHSFYLNSKVCRTKMFCPPRSRGTALAWRWWEIQKSAAGGTHTDEVQSWNHRGAGWLGPLPSASVHSFPHGCFLFLNSLSLTSGDAE